MPARSEIDTYIVNKVREYRKKKGFSQEALSLAIDKNPKYIGLFEAENSTRTYNPENLNRIADVLDISPRLFWPEKAFKSNN